MSPPRRVKRATKRSAAHETEAKRSAETTPNAAPEDLPEDRLEDRLEDRPEDRERLSYLEDLELEDLQAVAGHEDPAEIRLAEDGRDVDAITAGVDPELAMDGMREYSDDTDALDDFADRQNTGDSGILPDRLRKGHAGSLNAIRINADADWERAGRAEEDAEQTDAASKPAQNDLHRWELNAASPDEVDEIDPDDLVDRLEALEDLGIPDAQVVEPDENSIAAHAEMDDLEDLVDDLLLGGLDDFDRDED